MSILLHISTDFSVKCKNLNNVTYTVTVYAVGKATLNLNTLVIYMSKEYHIYEITWTTALKIFILDKC